MCPHDDFEILYYHDGILVRRCKDCKQVEVKTERWVEPGSLALAIEETPALQCLMGGK